MFEFQIIPTVTPDDTYTASASLIERYAGKYEIIFLYGRIVRYEICPPLVMSASLRRTVSCNLTGKMTVHLEEAACLFPHLSPNFDNSVT